MRRALSAALITLALAGCSAPSQAGPQPTTTESKPAVPKVTDEQSADLMKRISPVAPKFTQEEIATNSRYVCAAILQGGSDKALVATVVKHFNRADDPIADTEAAGVVEAIRANGFCQENGAS
ncbi:lipoprotein [Arthrobacter sp. WCS2018Hpa-7]|uniref:lipoprotein n=2 Tax=Arthrobacter TaxID=1663 RepID=UPI00288340CA|nr:lipoprotein [Arthrobacter sp. WCS2018Hpa-7]